MLGDINIAEPNALIGFAGPRVVKETIGKDLPEGFQRSEFLLEHGFLDFIVERKSLKAKLTQYLKYGHGLIKYLANNTKSPEHCSGLFSLFLLPLYPPGNKHDSGKYHKQSQASCEQGKVF